MTVNVASAKRSIRVNINMEDRVREGEKQVKGRELTLIARSHTSGRRAVRTI